MFNKAAIKRKEEYEEMLKVYENSPKAKGICLDYRHHLVDGTLFGFSRQSVIVYKKQIAEIKEGEPFGDYYHVVKVINAPGNTIEKLIIIDRN